MVDGFFRKVADAVLGGNSDRADQDDDRRVRPASEDPYGDPADYQDPYNNYNPASQDPYGDPGYGQFGNVRPASEDPYGDPADEENRW